VGSVPDRRTRRKNNQYFHHIRSGQIPWDAMAAAPVTHRYAAPFKLALIGVSPKHLAGFRIDQVQPRANQAGNRLISIAFALGRIVSDPALHVHARIRAAEDKSGHSKTIAPLRTIPFDSYQSRTAGRPIFPEVTRHDSAGAVDSICRSGPPNTARQI
jgi:hypothetical protein